MDKSGGLLIRRLQVRILPEVLLYGPLAKLEGAPDLRSGSRNGVRVRVPGGLSYAVVAERNRQPVQDRKSESSNLSDGIFHKHAAVSERNRNVAKDYGFVGSNPTGCTIRRCAGNW